MPALAGLCAVMLGVPLAVLGSATGPTDDPKAWALPILVALTALVWLVHGPRGAAGVGQAAGTERVSGAEGAAARGGRWVAAIVAAYGLWWVVTTAAGLAPIQSLLGNFGRGLGLLAFGSAILLFPLVRAECRSPRAVRSLVDAALLGSAPVCLLALAQAAGWDPLPAAWDPVVRSLTVRSTFGQHIFLGSYLVALIPLAAARLDWDLHDRAAAPRDEHDRRVHPAALAGAGVWVAGAVGLVAIASRWEAAWWLLVPWGVTGALALVAAGSGAMPRLPVPLVAALLATQLVVVILTQARGPFLGMLAGVAVAALGLLALRRAWRTLAASLAVLTAVTLFVGLLNVPGSPVAPLRTAPLLGRLGRLADVEPRSPGWVRLQIWRGALDGWQRQLRGEEMVPGTSPRLRSLVGYGLETQLVTLDRLALPWLGVLHARGEGWRAQYVIDRAHNVVLEHLVTGGLIGVALWALLIGGVVAAGIARARAAATRAEAAIRVGALGTVVAHVVEGQVGIATPMPLALFWVAAGLCASPSWAAPAAPPRPPGRTLRIAVVVAMALAAGAVASVQTGWLLASVAYADGVRGFMAGRMLEARERFRESRALVPGLALPAEAAASTAYRLAGGESDRDRRRAFLEEADAILGDLRGGLTGATYWTLRAQVSFGLVRAGERGEIGASLEAFDQAARLRPRDAQLLTQWAWALLEAGDPDRARATARRAVEAADNGERWLAWAVIARSARDLGDDAEALEAARAARRLAPPASRQVLESLLAG